jgi:hypothetical protein
MPGNFIPRNDAEFLAWVLNLSTRVTATPVPYGLSAGIATTLAGLVSTFETALEAATDPSTRGKQTVLIKSEARTTLENYCRVVARQVQGTSTVTNPQRNELGLTVRDVEPSSIPAPGMAPGMVVTKVDGRMVGVRLFDPANPTRRRKPVGVQGATVMSYVGETAPLDPSAWKFEGSVTRTKAEVLFPLTVPAGAKVWLTAFWFNPRAEGGPACAPVGTHVQFGGDMPMAA